jgi:hypothetical protein
VKCKARACCRRLNAKANVSWRRDWLCEYYEYPGIENVRPCRGVRADRYKLIRFFTEPQEFEPYDLQVTRAR